MSPLDAMARDLREQARADRERNAVLLSCAAKAEKLARALGEAGEPLERWLPESKPIDKAQLLDARWQAAIDATFRAYMPEDAARVQSYRNRVPAHRRPPTVTQEARTLAGVALATAIHNDPEFADLAAEIDAADTKGETDEFPF